MLGEDGFCGRGDRPRTRSEPAGSGTISFVDSLRRDTIARARATPPAQKLEQALELQQSGIELKRARLRAEDPSASEEVIRDRLFAWLAEDR